MSTQNRKHQTDIRKHLSSLETIQLELGKAQTMGDFFGKNGIFAHLFAETLEAELSTHLGYEAYDAK